MMDWGASNAKCRMRRTRLPVSGEFISCSLTILVITKAAPSPASLRSFSSDPVYTGTDKSFDTVSSTFLKEADSFCARFWATVAKLSEWVRAATRKNGKTTGRTDIERIRTFIETPPSGVWFPHHASARASLQGVRPTTERNLLRFASVPSGKWRSRPFDRPAFATDSTCPRSLLYVRGNHLRVRLDTGKITRGEVSRRQRRSFYAYPTT